MEDSNWFHIEFGKDSYEDFGREILESFRTSADSANRKKPASGLETTFHTFYDLLTTRFDAQPPAYLPAGDGPGSNNQSEYHYDVPIICPPVLVQINEDDFLRTFDDYNHCAYSTQASDYSNEEQFFPWPFQAEFPNHPPVSCMLQSSSQAVSEGHHMTAEDLPSLQAPQLRSKDELLEIPQKREPSASPSITPSDRMILEPHISRDPLTRDASRMSKGIKKNAEGLLPCSEEGCRVDPFKRDCEWRKHMDTHDKPWICPQPECHDRGGFTWKGGLTRHLREVHLTNIDGREQYRCNEATCKRSSGSGFKRKENLLEHLKSVHGFKDEAVKMKVREISSSSDPGTPLSAEEKVLQESPSSPPTSIGPLMQSGYTPLLALPRKRELDYDADAEYDWKRHKHSETELIRNNTRLKKELEAARRYIDHLHSLSAC